MNASPKNQVYGDARGMGKMPLRAWVVTLLATLALSLAAQAEVVAEWNVTDKDSLPPWAQLYLNKDVAEAHLSLDTSAKSDAGNGALKIDVIKNSSAKNTDIQFWITKDDGIVAGKYRITLLVKGSMAEEAIPFGFIQSDAPFANFDSGKKSAKSPSLNVDKKWKTMTIDFEAIPGFENKRVRIPCFFLGALPESCTLWIASVKLEKLP